MSNLPAKYQLTSCTDPYTLLGFAFSVLAGLCFTSSNVMVKFIPEVNSWQLLFVRCVLQMLVMAPIMIYNRSNPFGTPDFATRWRIQAQGALGGVLLLGIFEAVGSLPLGDATAIFFSSPAFTLVLSAIILKEHCATYRTLIAAVLLGGVVILSRPPALFPPPPSQNTTNSSAYSHGYAHDPYEGAYDVTGILAAVMVPILSALIVIITRQAKHIHYSVFVFWFAVGGQIVSIFGIYFFQPQGPTIFENWEVRQWVLSFLVAFVGIVGSILMTKAVCWVAPSKVMVVRSFEVVAAYILQVTVFDTPTYLSDVGGTLLILLAVALMGVEDLVMQRVRWRFI